MPRLEDAGLKATNSAVIKGILRFSSLTKKTNPNPNSQFDKKPSYHVTLAKPELVSTDSPEDKENFLKYIKVAEFDSTAKAAGPNGEKRITFEDKAPNAPTIFDTVVRKEHGDPANELLTEGELGNGQEIQVSVQVFKPKNFNNLSLGLDAILIHDASHIQYGNSGPSINTFGLDANPDAPAAKSATTDATASDDTNASTETTKADPFGTGAGEDANFTDPNDPFKN